MYYYLLFSFFAVIVYMITVDKNVAEYLILQLKLLRINLERLKWMIVHHPNNFITTWVMNRKYKKFIKEMESKD